MPVSIRGLFYESSIPVSVKRLHSKDHVFGIGGVAHSHDFTEVVIFTRGRGTHNVNGTDYTVGRGDVFVIEHVDYHHLKNPRDLEYYEIVFQHSFLGSRVKLLEQIPGFVTLFLPPGHHSGSIPYRRYLRLEEEQLDRLVAVIDEALREHQQQSVGFEAALHSHLVNILVYLSRCYPRTGNKDSTTSALSEVAPIIETLQQDLSASQSLEELAALGNMSTSKLLVVFREATGMTPIEYRIKLRVRRAMFELRNTKSSVTQIAYNVGFSDSNYFARQFRKVVGMSPSTYRRSGQH